MAKLGLAGDWHGNARWAVSALGWFAARGVKVVYQVGDLGLWPGTSGEVFIRDISAACEKLGICLWVIPGNHEDWSQIEDVEGEKQVLCGNLEEEGWEVALLPRGYQWDVEGRTFVALGGAPSIDFEGRREWVSWWRGEMIREEHLLRLASADVMLAHDAPTEGTEKVQDIINTPPHLSMWSEAGLRYAREGREMMDRAYEIVDPVLFVHGHYHVGDYREDEDGKHRFLSLNLDGTPDNVAVLDTDTLEVEINREY